MTAIHRKIAALLVVLGATWACGSGTLPLVGVAYADPPAHAPAHGWRRKQAERYRGYTGEEWEHDYGVRSGRCNTDEILAVVGAVAGGVIGNRTASDGNRTVATILGAVIGGVLGAKLGDGIDDRDRACIGHTLELAAPGRSVTWRNPDSGVDYTVKPLRDLRGGCREFELGARVDGRREARPMRACRDERGAWEFSERR